MPCVLSHMSDVHSRTQSHKNSPHSRILYAKVSMLVREFLGA